MDSDTSVGGGSVPAVADRVRIAVVGGPHTGKSALIAQLCPSTPSVGRRGANNTGVAVASLDGGTRCLCVEFIEIPAGAGNSGVAAEALLSEPLHGAILMVDAALPCDKMFTEACALARLVYEYQSTSRAAGATAPGARASPDIPLLVLVSGLRRLTDADRRRLWDAASAAVTTRAPPAPPNPVVALLAHVLFGEVEKILPAPSAWALSLRKLYDAAPRSTASASETDLTVTIAAAPALSAGFAVRRIAAASAESRIDRGFVGTLLQTVASCCSWRRGGAVGQGTPCTAAGIAERLATRLPETSRVSLAPAEPLTAAATGAHSRSGSSGGGKSAVALAAGRVITAGESSSSSSTDIGAGAISSASDPFFAAVDALLSESFALLQRRRGGER